MLHDRFDRGSRSGSRQKRAEAPQMEAAQPQPEVVESKEKFHPMAKQYVQEIQTFLGALKHYQEHGWKGIQDSWKFPEKAAQEIMVLGHTTEIVLQMTAEEMMTPKSTMDTELLHKVHGAPLVTGDGRFLKRNNGGKGEMRETSARGLLPALQIDDIPGHADEEYLVQLGETAQLDLLLRDIYSRFLLDVSLRLSYSDVHGTDALKPRLLHDLMYSDSVNKKNVPAPFSAEEYTEDTKKRVRIGDVYESQLDKFLKAEPFTLLENDAADPENRTVYIDNADELDKLTQKRYSSIRTHLQPSPKETVLPIKPEKIFSLDYIRQATSEIRTEALGQWDKHPREDIKLGVKYRTDPASGVRYPRGSDSKEEKENMRRAVEEYALVKERIAALLKEKLRNKDEVESDPATVATAATAETKPVNGDKETAAAKLEAATAEKEALQKEVGRLSSDLEVARGENAKLEEALKDSVDASSVERSALNDQIERLTTVAKLSETEQKKEKDAGAARETALVAELESIRALLKGSGFGSRAETIAKASAALDKLLESK